MAYDIGRLRQQNLMGGYDQLTPGASGGMNYMDEGSNPTSPYTPGPGLEAVGAQQDSNAILGPDGQPLQQESAIQTPTVTQIGAPRVDPNSRTFQQTLDEMNAGYTPDYTSRDRNNALLDAPPVRGNPGWGRTLVAAGMSVKAQDPIKTAETVMYAPYYRDVEDWKTKADPYYKAAELENRQNINERTIVSNAATAYAAAEKARIAEQNNIEKNRINEVRAKAYAWKQMHPDWDWDTTGPTYVLKGPNGEIKDTGIKTGEMSAEDLQLLKNKGSIAAARARGEAAVGVAQAGAIAGNRDVLVIGGVPHQRNADGSLTPIEGGEAGGAYRPGTGPPRASGTGAGGSSTNRLEARRQINDRLQETYETDPTNRDYVKKTGEGKFQFAERPVVGKTVGSTFGFGGRKITEQDVQAYDDYRSSVDPSYKPPTKGLGPSTSAVPNTNTGSRTSDPGTIEATGPDGKTQKITNTPENIEEFKRRGYRVGPAAGGVGPSTPPEKWKPRGDYSSAGKSIPEAGSNKPWFVDKAKDIYAEASKKPTGPREASGLPEKQVVTPEGIINVPHGKVAIRDKETGQVVQIPEANLAKAIATGKYTKVK